MATNDWNFIFSALFLCVVVFTSGTVTGEGNTEYQIANSNNLLLTSDASLAISFTKANANSRFKRAADSGAISADTSTNSGNGTLPDDANSPNSSAPVTSPPATSTPKPPASTEDPFKDADQIHDEHRYYNSTIHKDSVDEFWVELQSTPKHETLSDGHRVAVVIPLKFTFYFYGHPVTNVTIATGGFIYMSPFLHQWLTATQYIAPLMANFDPSFAEGSSIFYKSYDSKFIVEWRNVVLRDQNNTGQFSFQAILKNDSSIAFVYKNIPVAVSDISSEQHPVKIGLSDAYYNDTYLPAFNVKKRTIYEYHKVIVPTNTIRSGTVVILNSLPTCNRLDSCDACTKHDNVDFNCRWCNKIGRCSDGLDWYRQHWDRHGCRDVSIAEECRSTTSTTSETPQSPDITTTTTTAKTDTASTTTTSITTTETTSTTTTSTTTSTTTTSTTTTDTSSTTTTTDQTVAAGAQRGSCDSSYDTNECPLPHVLVSMTTTTSTTTTSATTISKTSPMVNASEMKIGCNHTTDSSVCSSLPPPPHPIIDPLTPIDIDKCAGGKCKKKDIPVAVIVIVILALVGLLGSVAGWVYYAYTHPTSRSGMWLMEHRPSEIKAKIKFWKSSSDSSAKYKAESEA